MRMVQPPIYQIIDVIGVRHAVVSAAGRVLMGAAGLRGAVHGICRVRGKRMLVNMIAMDVVQMPVVQVIDMAFMANRRMTAVRAVLVSMVGMVLLSAGGHAVCSFRCFSAACSKAF
jgi:hypothetical protein